MKKVILAACLAISATVTMTSCVNSTQPSDNFEIAGGKNVDYTFEYPKTWVKSRDDGMIAVKSSETDANISVTAFRPTEDFENPETYLEKYTSSFEETLGDYTEISRENVKIDETDAVKVNYSASIMDSEFMFSSVICIHNHIVYTITYTATENDFELHSPTLAHVIQTFDFQ